MLCCCGIISDAVTVLASCVIKIRVVCCRLSVMSDPEEMASKRSRRETSNTSQNLESGNIGISVLIQSLDGSSVFEIGPVDASLRNGQYKVHVDSTSERHSPRHSGAARPLVDIASMLGLVFTVVVPCLSRQAKP